MGRVKVSILVHEGVVVAFSAVGIALSYILQTFLSISRSVACYFLLYNRLLSVQIHHVETPQHTFSASSTRHFESRPSMVVYFRRWYRRGSKSLDRASTRWTREMKSSDTGPLVLACSSADSQSVCRGMHSSTEQDSAPSEPESMGSPSCDNVYSVDLKGSGWRSG